MRKIYFSILFIFVSVCSYAQTDSTQVSEIAQVPEVVVTKAQADSAYINNDFASAVYLYENILANQGESADIYYNLGNSYYKMDNIAKAIVNYEKALVLNPADGDIRFNLELAQSKTVDKVTPMSEVFLVTWMKNLTDLMSEKGWAKMGITTFILMLSMLALYFFSKKIALKKIGFISAVCLLFICVIANIFASSQKNKAESHGEAIIMAPSVTVKSTPNDGGTDLFILHEGHKVTIKDNTMREWKEIQLEDGNVGWVPTSVIEII
jgi:tetratricopeptide (TPR) repeat protein